MAAPAFLSEKSPDAFRTISEVAVDLDVPQHVLRFWESRFNQIKPVKRAGGRRYYRPEDIDLIRGIRALLYADGLTIRGVQKVLKDRGLRYVASIGRGDATQMFAAPSPVVIEKVVYVERPAAPMPPPVPLPKKRPTHLRAVPKSEPAPMSLPFFDTPAPTLAPVRPAPALEEWSKLQLLLDELLGLKAKLRAAKR